MLFLLWAKISGLCCRNCTLRFLQLAQPDFAKKHILTEWFSFRNNLWRSLIRLSLFFCNSSMTCIQVVETFCDKHLITRSDCSENCSRFQIWEIPACAPAQKSQCSYGSDRTRLITLKKPECLKGASRCSVAGLPKLASLLYDNEFSICMKKKLLVYVKAKYSGQSGYLESEQKRRLNIDDWEIR